MFENPPPSDTSAIGSVKVPSNKVTRVMRYMTKAVNDGNAIMNEILDPTQLLP